MNKSFPVLLVPLAALLLAGTALAQTDSSRIARACTKSTLATDPSAPCSDDVLNDGRGDILILTRPPPVIGTAGTLSTGATTTIQPGADVTGVGPGAPGNTPGAASTGTSLTGTGAASTSGTAGMTGRR